MSESPNESPSRVLADYQSGVIERCQGRIAGLKQQLAVSQAEVARLQVDLLEATRICDTLGCLAAVVRLDSGSRICGAGHASRWVERADLVASETREATLREALVELTDWGLSSDDVCAIARAALAAPGKAQE